MIGLGSNRLTVCRRGGMSVTQAGRGGMEWLAGGRMPSWASPYSAQATAALKAQFPTQWPTIRDYGFAHPVLVPFINEDPMLVMSLIEGLGRRWLSSTAGSSIKTDIRASINDKIQFRFRNANVSSDNGILSHNPRAVGSTYYRIFNYSNGWMYDYLNNSGGRISGGSVSANTWYDVEVGNRYIKNLATGTNFLSGSIMTTEFAETYYEINCGRNTYPGDREYLKVYDNGGNLKGHCVPCKHKVEGVEYKGWLNIVTLVFSYNEQGSFTISETPS